MKKSTEIFKECKVWWWGGWYIPVRNKWTGRYETMHLTDEERIKYEQEFGNKIISDEDFIVWYEKIYGK